MRYAETNASLTSSGDVQIVGSGDERRIGEDDAEYANSRNDEKHGQNEARGWDACKYGERRMEGYAEKPRHDEGRNGDDERNGRKPSHEEDDVTHGRGGKWRDGYGEINENSRDGD